MTAVIDYSQFGTAGEALKQNALRLRRAWARGFKPPPRMSIADWAERYRRFPEESPFPGAWKHQTAPYLKEIMEKLSAHDPCEEISILKSSQSGGSASAENWVG